MVGRLRGESKFNIKGIFWTKSKSEKQVKLCEFILIVLEAKISRL
jgi:hypothetical protein